MKRKIYESAEGGTPTNQDSKVYDIGRRFDYFIFTKDIFSEKQIEQMKSKIIKL